MSDSCEKIIEIIDRLLGPKGCPWDREQTLLSLRESVLEEVCEVIDAINSGDKEHIQEEFGDLLFNALFLVKVAEKENVCSLTNVISELSDKLIRRHPHVFGEVKTLTTDEHIEQWESIKQGEKGKESRSTFDGIPVSLPALARGQKMLKRLIKKEIDLPDSVINESSPIGVSLWKTIQQAHLQGIDAEQELRTLLGKIEQYSQK